MSLSLPSSSSALRGMFDLSTLVEMGLPENRCRVPMMKDIRRQVNVPHGAKSVNVIGLTMDGRLQLAMIGQKGGFKMLWDFGPI